MSEPESHADPHVEERSAPRWRKRLVLLLLLVVAGSIVVRIARAEERAPPPSSTPGMGSQLVPDGGGSGEQAEAEPEPVDKVLPYVTEGGIAMMIGLFLGMVTRAFLKIGLVLAVAALATAQFLAYKGIVTIDWGALRDFVWNITPDGDWATIVREKLPSAGALGLGYLLGLKRG